MKDRAGQPQTGEGTGEGRGSRERLARMFWWVRRSLARPFRWIADTLDPPCIRSYQVNAGQVVYDGTVVDVPLATVTLPEYLIQREEEIRSTR